MSWRDRPSPLAAPDCDGAEIDKFVLQALNSSISRDCHLIGKVCNALGFIELPFVRHCPRSSFRQDNHALFVRADRPVLTSMPLLFAQVICLLSLRVFRTLPRTLCASDDHLLHLWQSLNEFCHAAEFTHR